ncbi:signal peptide peptidase SppA [Pseudodesulfovibrio thermohalotolerans]|uniref:signal peptide peptidase SppA n=1 Tax=Pseudodesulfovibrio thermohalotolerans TaxID=2880651 RepID=UPI00244261EE|nr:signal peptide peptidase SppA [Pseudodesulfovibrio thermohalotolerans]WFS63449.1 signal peptide peptidase SppA [Pseudodesulfovibrio thermohalotolerans]
MTKRAANLLAGQFWAIHPDKLEAIAALTERLLVGERGDFSVFRKTAGDEKRISSYQEVDGVAVIPVNGVIAFRMNMFDLFSGGTSTEIIGKAVRRAAGDPDIRAIVLDIDSPGGTVGGLCDLTAEIREAAKAKPVISWAGAQMCSGAYWLGSAATEVICSPDATIGSVGGAYVHHDLSGKDEKEGVKRTILSAGKYKRIVNDAEPLSEEGEAYLQTQIDDYYTLFVNDVAANMGLDAKDVLDQLADGSVHVGEKALKRGFVHFVGSKAFAFERALKLAATFNQEATRMPAGKNTAGDTNARGGGSGVLDVSALTAESLANERPDLYAAIKAEGLAEGVNQERQRVLSLLAVKGDHEATVTAIQDGIATEAFLQTVLEATRSGQVQDLKDFEQSLSASAGSSASGVGADTDPVAAAGERMKAYAQAKK